MEELKPCPFCGAKATLWREGGVDRPYHILCGCGGRVGWFETREEAIEAWNRRTESEELEFTRGFIHDNGLDFALASAWNRRVSE